MDLPPEDFAIRESHRQDSTVLTLRGDLDLATAESLTARLAQHREAKQPVILDLDALNFIDSSGLRVILQAVEDSRRSGWSFRVTAGSEPVQRLLRAAGLVGRLPVV